VTGVYLGLIYAPSNVDVPLSSVAGSRGQRRFEYLEPPQQAPLRLALGGGLLTLIGLFVVAAYAGQLGLELVQYWFVIMTAVPLTIGLLYAGARGRAALDADRPDRRAGRARGRGGRRLTAFISVPRWPWPARSSHWR
jgi:hypothetical protein